MLQFEVLWRLVKLSKFKPSGPLDPFEKKNRKNGIEIGYQLRMFSNKVGRRLNMIVPGSYRGKTSWATFPIVCTNSVRVYGWLLSPWPVILRIRGPIASWDISPVSLVTGVQRMTSNETDGYCGRDQGEVAGPVFSHPKRDSDFSLFVCTVLCKCAENGRCNCRQQKIRLVYNRSLRRVISFRTSWTIRCIVSTVAFIVRPNWSIALS